MRYMTEEEALGFLLPILCSKDNSSKPFVIAIDGRSASGKTTFASRLSEMVGTPVIHTDAFLRPRNKDGALEISEYSGNFDIDRFKSEAVRGMMGGKDFCISVFDCKKGMISETVNYSRSDVFIVEGAYSLHPELGKYWDLALFFDVDPETQKKRIIDRNGIESYAVFEGIWIPAEERYFEKYKIMRVSDLIIDLM